MGLAERFKNKLENKDIYKKEVIEQKLEENDIKFISKPIEDKIVPKNISIQTPVTIPDVIPEQEIKSEKRENLENLETEIIDKIRKTPYWEEYTKEQQINMIEKYFNVKTKSAKYNSVEYSTRDKQVFITTVLTLANNR